MAEMTAVKEFEVIFKIRNNLLLQHRLEHGVSAPKMAKMIGINYATYLGYESLRISPLCQNKAQVSMHNKEGYTGEWKESAILIAAFHGVSPEDLWPDVMRAVRKSKIAICVSAGEMEMLIGSSTQYASLPPDVLLEEKESALAVRSVVDALPERAREVIEGYFGFHGGDDRTMEDLGDEFGVSRERIRQIMLEAMRGIRREEGGILKDEAYGRRDVPVRPYRKKYEVKCPYCGCDAELVNSREIYGGRFYGLFYACHPCEAWVGVHDKTYKPLGRLANKELRWWRMKAYAAFDPLWKRKMLRDGCSKGVARKAGYTWLAGQLGIRFSDCHIGMFDVDMCRRIVQVTAHVCGDGVGGYSCDEST